MLRETISRILARNVGEHRRMVEDVLQFDQSLID
jgi:hypothetical protein